MDRKGENRHRRTWLKAAFLVVFAVSSLFNAFVPTTPAFAADLILKDLIEEASKNSNEVLVSQAKAAAAGHKIPQAKSLPDPMFMFGYQNEGTSTYTYGEEDAQWMYSVSQMFPFPGKLGLKGEMAARDAESLRFAAEAMRLQVIAKVKDLYYDLFFTYKEIDILNDKRSLFLGLEDAAVARYASGMGQQQEVLMAQTEKYMLVEKEEMLKQRIQAIEGMLNTTVGRDVHSPLSRPGDQDQTPFPLKMEELIQAAHTNSPVIGSRQQMISAAEAKVQMARKEYYPDFTLTAGYFDRGGDFMDMVSLTATINVPIFYATKQKEGVHEAMASLSEAKHELDSAKLMLASAIRDNHSMVRTAENLMGLYKNALMPKISQDVEASLAGYVTGKVEAITVLSRLKALLEIEILYWKQFAEREKAIARIEGLVGEIVK